MPTYPSFFALNRRMPEPGIDFDPNAPMSEDDYQFFMGIGDYDNAAAVVPMPADVMGWIPDAHDEEERDYQDQKQQEAWLRMGW